MRAPSQNFIRKPEARNKPSRPRGDCERLGVCQNPHVLRRLLEPYYRPKPAWGKQAEKTKRGAFHASGQSAPRARVLREAPRA